jgi:hypothetical protein
MKYFCCEKRRLNAVKEHPTLNGIAYIDVKDNPADAFEDRQTTLMVHFVKDLVPGSLTKQNVRIEGGERIKNIVVVEVTIGETESPPSSPLDDPMKVLTVKVKEAGDFSTYTLRLVTDKKNNDPPPGFDPVVSVIDFSFKVLCAKDFDCKPEHECPPDLNTPPEINYLAKDYASFRQLMLDRMAVLMPQWKERNPADLGIVLVELLAYAGDYLSYRQDAIATEAYLGRARKRISVRRHARLVDYFMQDGCNARTWVHIDVEPGVKGVWLRQKSGEEIATQMLTKTAEKLPEAFRFDKPEYEKALTAGALVFEPLHDEEFYDIHNEMKFYTWGDKECCLPKGATSATLRGDLSTLRPGQVVIFKEVKGPQTGAPSDADPTRRHAVRLTEVVLAHDPLFEDEEISSPLTPGIPVTKIKWNMLDALPFPICLSAKTGTSYFDDVSVALGNNVLVDHGRTIRDATESSLDPGSVADAVLATVSSDSKSFCDHTPAAPVPPRYAPMVKYRPLTHAAPYGIKNIKRSAAEAMKWSMRETMPAIYLTEKVLGEKWFPKRDLLNSVSDSKEFVVEIESDGVAHLRFGDDILGMRPIEKTTFLATYRIGNGLSGNIGREAIGHLVTDNPDFTGGTKKVSAITNPFPATGGTEPESIELVRQKAPSAFRTQERAVTRGDYEEVSKRSSDSIQRAACTFRWTGSWRTAFLTIDRFNGEEVDEAFEKDLRLRIEQYRLAGQDIEVNGPTYVSLEVEMEICVKANYFASDVKTALLKVFSNRILPDGRRGVFHPDNFSFGQTVFLSPLYAAAQTVDGVASVKITTFKRQGDWDNAAIDSGKLLLSKLEIARLDNDPNFADHGVLNLVMKGGK